MPTTYKVKTRNKTPYQQLRVIGVRASDGVNTITVWPQSRRDSQHSLKRKADSIIETLQLVKMDV